MKSSIIQSRMKREGEKPASRLRNIRMKKEMREASATLLKISTASWSEALRQMLRYIPVKEKDQGFDGDRSEEPVEKRVAG